MHRDTRTGLALGILLVGIVGALFFRDESHSVPQLEDPQSLDAEIAEKPIVPYLLHEPENADHEVVTPRQSKSHNVIGSQAAPDPIPVQNVSQQVTPSSVPIGKSHPTPMPSNRSNTTQLGSDNQAVVNFVYHVVEPGDTLTSLAVKYLDNSARYPEIYRLNRNRLKDPNNLPAGMKIRIPAKPATRNADHPATRKRVSQTNKQRSTEQLAAEQADQVLLNIAVDTDKKQVQNTVKQPPPVKRFVPVNRNPFGSGRTALQFHE